MTITRNGQNGLVYGGDPDLVHIKDGTRAALGMEMAEFLTAIIRVRDPNRGAHLNDTPLCPGCSMLAGYNMIVAMAQMNGYPMVELAINMKRLFEDLEMEAAKDKPFNPLREELEIVL